MASVTEKPMETVILLCHFGFLVCCERAQASCLPSTSQYHNLLLFLPASTFFSSFAISASPHWWSERALLLAMGREDLGWGLMASCVDICPSLRRPEGWNAVLGLRDEALVAGEGARRRHGFCEKLLDNSLMFDGASASWLQSGPAVGHGWVHQQQWQDL